MLFQERLKSEPFWMLVACVLVNRTRWSQAEPVFNAVRERWSSPHRLSWANDRALEEVLRPLGFSRQRARQLHELAIAWQHLWIFEHRWPHTADDVLALPGCRRYAADSWAIFVEGRTDVQPVDRALREHLAVKRTLPE